MPIDRPFELVTFEDKGVWPSEIAADVSQLGTAGLKPPASSQLRVSGALSIFSDLIPF